MNSAQVHAFIASRLQDLDTGNYSNPKPWRSWHFGKVIPYLRPSDPPDIATRSGYASCQYLKNGGSHAELESAICIFTASPSPHTRIYSRSNFNCDDGEHDTPRYAGRRARRRVVLQKEGKHELCVPNSRAVSDGHERKGRHLRPTQASLSADRHTALIWP